MAPHMINCLETVMNSYKAILGMPSVFELVVPNAPRVKNIKANSIRGDVHATLPARDKIYYLLSSIVSRTPLFLLFPFRRQSVHAF